MGKRIVIDAKKYNDAWEYYKLHYELGDNLLYDLCRRCPSHTKLSEVVAKVWLISRSYAADPVRHNKSIDDVALHLTQNREEVQKLFGAIKKINIRSNRLDVGSLRVVVETHGRFMDLLDGVKKTKRENKSRKFRSFASKYLHFHFPAIVPLYDSRARSSIHIVVPSTSLERMIATGDLEYADFCNRLIVLWNEANSQGLEVSMKRLDQFLLFNFGA